MVQQKRLGYGFNGYQVPSMPRGSRSARGKTSFKKKVDSDNMCAFNLLATVAGELLQEKESSLSSRSVSAPLPNTAVGIDAVKREHQDQVRHFKEEPYDQGSCDESVLSFQKRVQKSSEIDILKDHSHTGDGSYLRCASVITKSDESEKVTHEDLTVKRRNGFGSCTISNHGLVGVRRDCINSSGYHKGEADHAVRDIVIENQGNTNFTAGVLPNMCHPEDPMVVNTKPPTLVSSDSSVEVPLCGDHVPYIKSFGNYHNDVKILRGDDDENSSGCTDPGTRTMRSYKPPHIGDRRIRKFMGSKFYKVSPTFFKNGEPSNFVSDNNMKPVFRSRKFCYARQRTQRFSTYKRRRLFERCSTLASDSGNSSEGLSNSPGKAFIGEASISSAKKLGANGTSSSLVGERSSYGSGDSHVKLRIKSFKVPELLIEIPETATVGLLKRTVLEAVTAILGSGIRIGVLLQGKKVRDDSKTLLQSGISLDEKLDGLGFALEPGPARSSLPPLCKEAHFSHADETQAVSRHPTIPPVDIVTSDASIAPALTNNSDESNHALVPTPADMVLDRALPSSQALVAIPAMSVEALAVVPLQRKSRRPELAQRRIRRPFSVTEVEALVQAVEKLGTGRWRDVKLRAFENAKHRTYVDLKDKWKTLVHTARISPQQRRGEPVPQELLDRVLSAHAHWSQQQAKQQIKQQGESCLL